MGLDPSVSPGGEHRGRDAEVLDGESGRVEGGDFVRGRATRRAVGEHGTDLGHVRALDLAAGDRAGELTSGRGLRPFVAEEPAAADGPGGHLGLAVGVGAEQRQVLARDERVLGHDRLARRG